MNYSGIFQDSQKMDECAGKERANVDDFPSHSEVQFLETEI